MWDSGDSEQLFFVAFTFIILLIIAVVVTALDDKINKVKSLFFAFMNASYEFEIQE